MKNILNNITNSIAPAYKLNTVDPLISKPQLSEHFGYLKSLLVEFHKDTV